MTETHAVLPRAFPSVERRWRATGVFPFSYFARKVPVGMPFLVPAGPHVADDAIRVQAYTTDGGGRVFDIGAGEEWTFYVDGPGPLYALVRLPDDGGAV